MASRDSAPDVDGRDQHPVELLVDRVLAVTETVIYAVVALALIVGATLLLVSGIAELVRHVDDGIPSATTDLLSSLLLVFIFVELLGAVRATVRERGLVAEPFLIVGIIASIKEIVLIAAAEPPADEDFAAFRDEMIEIGALTGVVLLLAIAALLLRRRAREPSEQRAAE